MINLFAIVALVGLAAPDGVQAFQLQVTTVQAANTGKTDPELRRLRPRLKRVAGYRSYRLVRRTNRDCALRHEQEFILPGGEVLRLRPHRVSAGEVLVQIRLLDGARRMMDTLVRLPVMQNVDSRAASSGGMVLGLGQESRLADEATLIVLRAVEDDVDLDDDDDDDGGPEAAPVAAAE